MVEWDLSKDENKRNIYKNRREGRERVSDQFQPPGDFCFESVQPRFFNLTTKNSTSTWSLIIINKQPNTASTPQDVHYYFPESVRLLQASVAVLGGAVMPYDSVSGETIGFGIMFPGPLLPHIHYVGVTPQGQLVN